MNFNVKNVDEFIEASLEESRPHLQEIRETIGAAIPEAEEKIGYGKPFYKYHGWVAGMEVYKSHLNLEIWDGLSSEDREDLESKGYITGSKTFRIRYDQKVPTAIVKRLVKAQAKRNEQKAANKKK